MSGRRLSITKKSQYVVRVPCVAYAQLVGTERQCSLSPGIRGNHV